MHSPVFTTVLNSCRSSFSFQATELWEPSSTIISATQHFYSVCLVGFHAGDGSDPAPGRSTPPDADVHVQQLQEEPLQPGSCQSNNRNISKSSFQAFSMHRNDENLSRTKSFTDIKTWMKATESRCLQLKLQVHKLTASPSLQHPQDGRV